MIGNAGRLALLTTVALGGLAVPASAAAASAAKTPSHADTVVTVLCCSAAAAAGGPHGGSAAPSASGGVHIDAGHCAPYSGRSSCSGPVYACVAPDGSELDVLGGFGVTPDADACARVGIL